MKRCSLVKTPACMSLLAVVFASGCSQTRSTSPRNTDSASIVVSIDPPSLSLKHGDSWSFAATVSPADSGVIWGVQEGSSGGTVNQTGLYTSPSTDGIYHVTVTSKTDPTKSATATVSVGNSGFALVGSLGNARYGHTATLLHNGKVFVAGGAVFSTDPNLDDGIAVIGAAELFDPVTRVFQPAATVTRVFHTATLLQNGDVLFAGGIVDDTETEGDVLTGSAELLKADDQSMQPTGRMSLARYYHTATLLPDGRVLVAGGYGPDFLATRSAEVYDPALGRFTAVGIMQFARVGHTATLLSSGKVLIAGGGEASAELFDPVTNSFTLTGSTESKWVGAATALDDGRVLITGEANSDESGPLASEIYDPATGQFSMTGTMRALRFSYTATLLADGSVLIAGGAMSVAGPTPGSYYQVPMNSTEIFDPATGSFGPGPTLRQARMSSAAIQLPDGSVLIVGGRGGSYSNDVLASAELYR